VAPAVAAEFNTIRSFLIPRACWLVEDSSFEFDSSFISPDTFFEDPLIELLEKHPGAKLSIFGHADPSGRDPYNKTLSGRRAQAVFGLLTREVRLWEDLYYDHDQNGKDKWGVKSIQIMLASTGFSGGGEGGAVDDSARQALKDFEKSQALPQKGFRSDKTVERATFRKLVRAYMDVICTRGDGTPFVLTAGDFLAKGRGKDGKGDFQGCGEFNPLMLFSQAEKATLDKEKNRPERNRQNAVNRRVMVLLFRPGSQVDAAKWPCPTVKEGVEGCRKRFFSDGEERRSNGSERRTFEESRKTPGAKGTFACRFYDRLVAHSPCELIRQTFRIRLYDAFGQFMANAPCEVTIGGAAPFPATANSRGTLTLREVEVPVTCHIKWGHVPSGQAEPVLSYSMNVFLTASKQSDDEPAQKEEARQKLSNLGYSDPDPATNVADFQLDYGHLVDPPLAPTGELDLTTLELLRNVYDQAADDLRRTPLKPQGA